MKWLKQYPEGGMDLFCLQEVQWRGAFARMIVANDSCYKVFWIGSENGTGGVGILLSEEWIKKVCLMMIKLAIENNIITVLSCYAPQIGLDNTIKGAFLIS